MCYRAGAFLRPSAASDLAELVALGFGGVPSDHVLAIVDPLDDGTPGIEVREHPDVMLARQPALWSIVDAFRVGAHRRLRVSSLARLSHFETEALLVMQAAHAREEKRYIDSLRPSGGSTS